MGDCGEHDEVPLGSIKGKELTDYWVPLYLLVQDFGAWVLGHFKCGCWCAGLWWRTGHHTGTVPFAPGLASCCSHFLCFILLYWVTCMYITFSTCKPRVSVCLYRCVLIQRHYRRYVMLWVWCRACKICNVISVVQGLQLLKSHI